MTVRVLLVGLKPTVVDLVRERVAVPGLEVAGATDLAEVRAAFAEAPVAHVIMGAGLELGQRLDIVRAVFEISDATTVHLKDFASGPEGFGPFAESVLRGLHGS